MRLPFVALVALAACAPTQAPPVAASSPAPAPSTSPRAVRTLAEAWTSLCAGPDSVPMEVIGSRVFVTVTLAGSKGTEKLRFLVDTGGNTPGLTLHRAVAERLGFASASEMPRTLHIGDRDVALPEGAGWFLLDEDEARFEAATRKGLSVGQIGAGFLSRFVVCFDPAKGRMGLGEPSRFEIEPGGAKWIPLFMVEAGNSHARYPFFHVLLRDHGKPAGSYGMLLDTGAPTSMLERGEIERHRKEHPAWAAASGAFGDGDMLGGKWSEQVLRVDDVAIDAPKDALAQVGLREEVSVDAGPATFVDRRTGAWNELFGDVEATKGVQGALANDVLLRFRLLIDYPHARLFLEPSGQRPGPSSSASRIGVSLLFGADGCPEIRQITDTNAPETREKLRVGDVILSIDGQDACKALHHEIAAALAGPAGTVKKLGLRRGHDTVEVDVVTADLLR
jgi:hypothetical protein